VYIRALWYNISCRSFQHLKYRIDFENIETESEVALAPVKPLQKRHYLFSQCFETIRQEIATFHNGFCFLQTSNCV
jgi:hypothetical protein